MLSRMPTRFATRTIAQCLGRATRIVLISGPRPLTPTAPAPAAQSEHPSYSPASGAALTRQFLDILASNPSVYDSTVFMLTYDENDGLFDHVPPPVPPPGTPAEFVGSDPIGLGARVPMIL